MSAFASRYARALADVVLERKLDTASVDQQLKDFSATWHGSAELREVFLNPSIEAERKVAVLDGMRERLGLATEVRNFLAVLINHDRLDALDEIVVEYDRVMNSQLGIAEVGVITARKLDEAERHEMQEEIAKLAGGQVDAVFKEDSAILGGVILHIGSMVYDGSVRGRLSELREQLIAG